MQILILPIFGIIMIGHNEVIIPLPITIAIIENTLGLFAISARPSTFLDIALKTLRNTIMDYESNISLIDTHSKCYCCNYDLDLVGHPFLLDLLSFRVW
jgi:hypothetical protein